MEVTIFKFGAASESTNALKRSILKLNWSETIQKIEAILSFDICESRQKPVECEFQKWSEKVQNLTKKRNN